MTTQRILTGALAMGLAVATLGACGDDDEASDEFCDVARELAAVEELPSDELLDRFVDEAPSEIEDEAERATDAIKEQGGRAFDDPDVADDIAVIEDYEADQCGIVSEDEGDDADDGTGDEDSPVVTDDTTDMTTDDSTGTTTDITTDDSIDDTDGEDVPPTSVEDTADTMTG